MDILRGVFSRHSLLNSEVVVRYSDVAGQNLLDRRPNNNTTSIRKVMRMSLVIRDVTSYRGVPYMARKLLKFPVRWRKFPCVNVRKIADA